MAKRVNSGKSETTRSKTSKTRNQKRGQTRGQANDPVTAVSLFTGAGGLDTGFEDAGIDVVCANEVDPTFCETFRLNHPDVNLVEGLIEKNMSRIPKGVDLVFGGPPCQGFSVAGKMRADDPRSKLIFRFLDVVDRCRPKMFVMENVKSLARLSRFDGVRKAYMRKVADLGYVCVPILCNATEYGVPQKRERVFFVGIEDIDGKLSDADVPGLACESVRELVRDAFDAQREAAPTVREALADLGKAGTDKNPKTCTAKIAYCKKPVMRSSAYAGMIFNGAGRPIEIDGYANTLPASMGGNKTPIIDEEYLHDHASDNWVEKYFAYLSEGNAPFVGEIAPERLRRLTINEAARLQTFPDDYEWAGPKSSIYKQIGNAVPCKLAEHVAKAVMEIMSEMFGDKPAK